MSDTAAGAKSHTEQPTHQECVSCKVITDGLMFFIAGYLTYHTYKHRRTVTGWNRTQLYIVNGLFIASKCFLSFLFVFLSDKKL